ncbi:regulation of nuclear pre-mRNA domain-containing protein 1B isoform X5 [Calonectris borealis]|uniref:regulation of nuclear pre-mRNA domain-containing protein 1B isoform X5 n=1 Tax=Calonectris borealis TaxID=1323832 RepID=UPI003F4B3B2A
MSSFSESALEKKLSELSNSQQSVQTLSLWLIHHRKHAGPIVSVWHRELRKAKSSRKLTFLYLANDVIQNSKRKGPEFTREFESVLVDAFSHVAREADEGCKKPLERLLNIWQERSVYGSEFIQQLKLSMEDSNSPQTKDRGFDQSPTRPGKRSIRRCNSAAKNCLLASGSSRCFIIGENYRQRGSRTSFEDRGRSMPVASRVQWPAGSGAGGPAPAGTHADRVHPESEGCIDREGEEARTLAVGNFGRHDANANEQPQPGGAGGQRSAQHHPGAWDNSMCRLR